MGTLVANQIRKIRHDLGLTQWRLGVLVDIDGSRISLLEQGVRPREHEKQKIAKVLKKSESEIWPEVDDER
jgi:predicted transcriptional regulator